MQAVITSLLIVHIVGACNTRFGLAVNCRRVDWRRLISENGLKGFRIELGTLNIVHL